MNYYLHKVPTKRLNIWDELKLAEANASGAIPVVQFGRHAQEYAALKLSDFLKLLRSQSSSSRS